MSSDKDGWYQCFSTSAHVGSRYQFRIDGDLTVPDPASSPMMLVSQAKSSTQRHCGIPCLIPEIVIYELHVGTFSEEGTYEGAQCGFRIFAISVSPQSN